MMLDEINASLPYWPSDLKRLWLLPEAGRKGWPPSETNEWHRSLGRKRNLHYLQQLRWRRQKLDLKPTDLAPSSLSLILQMFRGYYWKDPNEFIFSTFDGGLDRFENLTQYLISNKDYPWPPALEKAHDGLQILDGHHRILASFFVGGYLKARETDPIPTFIPFKLDYWIADI
jgi:hypothetical protein